MNKTFFFVNYLQLQFCSNLIINTIGAINHLVRFIKMRVCIFLHSFHPSFNSRRALKQAMFLTGKQLHQLTRPKDVCYGDFIAGKILTAIEEVTLQLSHHCWHLLPELFSGCKVNGLPSCTWDDKLKLVESIRLLLWRPIPSQNGTNLDTGRGLL